MSYRIGGHLRETLAEAELELVEATPDSIIVRDDDGKLEEWQLSPHYAGYALVHESQEYEFVTSISWGAL